MSIEMVLYLIGVLDKLSFFLCTVTLLCLLVMLSLFIFIITSVTDGGVSHAKNAFRLLKKYIITAASILIASIILHLVTPSEKTMYMMLACNAAKKSEIPEKVLKAIELKLDEYIDEVTDKVKK